MRDELEVLRAERTCRWSMIWIAVLGTVSALIVPIITTINSA